MIYFCYILSGLYINNFMVKSPAREEINIAITIFGFFLIYLITSFFNTETKSKIIAIIILYIISFIIPCSFLIFYIFRKKENVIL
jgi:hypothetical protein